jgi:hypothetical protein
MPAAPVFLFTELLVPHDQLGPSFCGSVARPCPQTHVAFHKPLERLLKIGFVLQNHNY